MLVIFVFLRNVSRHRHSERGGAAVAGRHFRRDVPAGLQPQQPDADGADDLHRLRGRRCHRDDREHRALHREGEAPLEAALKGAKQIGFTIVSLTVSLIAVLIPLLFMGDIVGRLFREFAVTLSVTILVSAVVSLTLTPMMCARLLRGTAPATSQAGSTGRRSVLRPDHRRLRDAGLRWVLQSPARHACWSRSARWSLTVLSVRHHPKGFFPVQDTGVILGISEAPQNISFTAMAERQQALATVILEDPAVESLSSFIGVDGTNTTLNSGRMSDQPEAARRARGSSAAT